MSTIRVFDDEADDDEPVRLITAPVAAAPAGPPAAVVPPLPAGYGRPTTVDSEPVPSFLTRALRLKTLHLSGLARFLLLEGVLVVSVLLYLSTAASAWLVLAAPLVVLAMIKLNDLVATALRRNPPLVHPPGLANPRNDS